MEFLQPIADLFGISTTMLLVLAGLFVVLVGAWYVLKFVVKMTWKVMSVGCAVIVLVIGGLYLLALLAGPGG